MPLPPEAPFASLVKSAACESSGRSMVLHFFGREAKGCLGGLCAVFYAGELRGRRYSSVQLQKPWQGHPATPMHCATPIPSPPVVRAR